MKKNFFKKLSFVLALAMIVSVIQPAAGVFAKAKAPALNTPSKTLLLGVEGRSAYDFNIKNPVAGSKYAWASSNKAVATVKSNGLVTAKAEGKAKITCVIKLKTGKKVTLSAPVVVKDNVKDITGIEVKDAADVAKLKVATDYTLTAKYVTASGASASKTAYIYYSVNSDKAAVKDGVFNATEAGKFTITALAFQSKAKCDAWVALKDAKSTVNVLASKTLDVEVAASIVSTKQIDTSKFAVTFDTNMSKSDLSATTAAVYQVIGGKQTSSGAEKIKAITYDTTGKIATVELYAKFNSKMEYNFVYGALVGKFTAAEVKLQNVATVEMADLKVDITSAIGTSMASSVVAKNADGVIIYTGEDKDLADCLTYTYNGDIAKGFVSGNNAYLNTEGYITTVAIKFSNFILNSATSKYETVTLNATGSLVGYKPDTNINSSALQFVVGSSASSTSDWTKSAFTIAAGDASKTIFARYKLNNATATTDYTYTSAGDNSKLTYISGDTDKLLINGTTLTALKAGDVTVIVKDTVSGTVLSSFNISIGASRTFANVTQDTTYVTVGNNAACGETATVTLYAKDTMNDSFVPGSVVAEVSAYPSTSSNTALHFGYGAIDTDATSATYGKAPVTVDARGAVAGAYNVKVTVTGLNGVQKVITFAVSVVEANTTATKVVAGYSVVLDKAAVDVKKADAVNTSTVSVYAVNAAGYRVAQVNNTDFAVGVKLNDVAVSPASIVAGNTISVVRLDGTLKPLAKGTYIVTATATKAITGRAASAVIGYVQLAVSDTTTLDVTPNTSVVLQKDFNTLNAAVLKAFTFKLNGTDITAPASGMSIVSYKVSTGAAAAADVASGATSSVVGNLYVESITVRYLNVDYTFNVGKTISIQ